MNVYRWTGCFPEQVRPLLGYMIRRADELKQSYAKDQEAAAILGITALLTALAMNHVFRGTFVS